MIKKLNPENENFMLFEDKLNEIIDVLNDLMAHDPEWTSGGDNYAGTQKVCRKCGEEIKE